MRKLLFFICCLTAINLHAQDWDDDSEGRGYKKIREHEEYKRDYFTVGLYTGSYIGYGSAIEVNDYLNSVSVELEYFKFTDLSVYVKGLYRFSNYKTSYYINDTYYVEEKPAYKLVTGFGGRYYVKKYGLVKPYLQSGLNQETEYIKSFFGGYYSYRYFINFGIGVSIKLSPKFSVDIKYDLNKSIDKETYYSFSGFSVLAGIKYNL